MNHVLVSPSSTMNHKNISLVIKQFLHKVGYNG